MGHALLVDVLPDFGEVASATFMHSAVHAAPESDHLPELEPAPDVDSIVAEAVDRAVRETEERLALAQAEGLIEVERRHAAELDALRKELGEKAGHRIADQFAEAERRMTELVMAGCARTLGQVMGDALKERSLEALAKAIRNAVRDDDAVRVRVSGPQSLYEPLLASLGTLAGRLDFDERPGFDAAVTIGDHVIETRIGEWAAAVEEILA